MCWCCLALCCSVPLWYETGPQKRPRRWWVGSKGSLRGILTSHLGPSFSHLCGGCKAPEQVSPSRWKSQLSVRELWPAVSLKPSFLGFWRKSCWTYIHTSRLLQDTRTQCVCTLTQCFSRRGGFCRCRALPCVEHLRETSGRSPGTAGSLRHYVHVRAFEQEAVARSKAWYSDGTRREPLNRYLFCFLQAKWPSRQLCFKCREVDCDIRLRWKWKCVECCSCRA